MFDKATSGIEPNNDRFSVCSKDSIKRNVNRVRSKPGSTCFIKSDAPICGNKIVEEGEVCDCGNEDTCTEDCCFPAGSNSQCELRLGKTCSPSQGLYHYKVEDFYSSVVLKVVQCACAVVFCWEQCFYFCLDLLTKPGAHNSFFATDLMKIFSNATIPNEIL